MGGDEADEQADDIYNQICEEQGIMMQTEALGPQASTGMIGGGQQNKEEVKVNTQEVDDLQARLDNLNQ